VPPALKSEMPPAYENLRDEIDKLGMLEPGVLREEYRKRITAGAHAEKLEDVLHIKLGSDGCLSDAQIKTVADHIHELMENRTPQSLHVLGEPPPDKDLVPYLVTILGSKYLDHLAAVRKPPDGLNADARRDWLRAEGERVLGSALSEGKSAPTAASADLAKDLEFAAVMRQRLLDTSQEITGLLRALEARYIHPGPGPEPIRNPDSAPGGRDLYALNPEEVPTRPAWELGVQLVDQMLAAKHPRKVGFDLNGMDTMRDFGVLESQVLYLMGVRPVWDQNNLAIDVELIPRGELKHARIDVFLAMGGMYKENFTSRVKLLDKAVRLASQADEDDNLVRLGTLETRRRLLAQGFTTGQADKFAPARIFGTKPGNMSGTNILYMVPRSGIWDSSDEVTDVYIDNMSFVYTDDVWGQKVDGLYTQSIHGTDTLVRVWASNMTSQLSNHHAYEYLGGLSMAVHKIDGKEPEALIADVRNPDGVRMRDFNEVLAANMQTELLNKKWIEGMKEHGYAGAGHLSELVKNTFGWSVTRENSVSTAAWNEIYAVYVQDKYNLGLGKWMDKENPHALQEIAATMLEAARKGRWDAPAAAVAALSRLYAESVVAHGDSGGLVSGGNKRLEDFVSAKLHASGKAPAAALAARMSAALRDARAPAAAQASAAAPSASQVAAALATALVTGERLEKVNHAPPPPAVPRTPLPTVLALFAALAFIAIGFILRWGVPC